MTCFFCKGGMETGTTTYMVDLDACIVIVKRVPCYKCTQCGEIAYNLDVGERLEQIVDELENSLAEVAIVQYSEHVA